MDAGKFIEIVRGSITEGQVADWVRNNVKKGEAEKKTFNDFILNRGRDNEESRARLQQRKTDLGLSQRDDVQTFADLIDADEKRR